MNLQRDQANELLYVGFNQDYGCFACGTDTGFKIYNVDPFKETFLRDLRGGIGHVEMLFRCNILALVGGGKNPRYPPNKVMIWDDHQNRCIGELSFRSPVRAVRLRRDRVVVVLEFKIYVYNFSDLKLVDHIETISNTKGLCALASSENTVLVCPGLQKGHVRVELYDSKKTTLIPAHETSLSCFALNADGTILATASEKGTLIRLFDTSSGQSLQEVRRGADRAEIYSLAFSDKSQWLACSSDKGTVHIWAVNGKDKKDKGKKKDKDESTTTTSEKDKDAKKNTTSSFSFMKSLLPKYFSSEWSLAQFKVPVQQDVRCLVAFGAEKNSIIITGADGSFFKVLFDPSKGTECVQESYAKFTKTDEES